MAASWGEGRARVLWVATSHTMKSVTRVRAISLCLSRDRSSLLGQGRAACNGVHSKGGLERRALHDAR
jgi:hypothetical protein